MQGLSTASVEKGYLPARKTNKQTKTINKQTKPPKNPREADPQSWMCWQDLDLFQSALNS